MLNVQNRLFTRTERVFLIGSVAVLALLWVTSLSVIRRGLGTLVFHTAYIPIKIRGQAPDCPWNRVLATPGIQEKAVETRRRISESIRLVNRDSALDINQYSTASGAFWIKASGQQSNGQTLLGFLLADHEAAQQYFSQLHIRSGDVVLDCGAHVGVFTDLALKAGASLVIAFEPDPANLECLRRNLEQPIRDHRVVVVPQAVWSSATTLTLTESTGNSGGNSVLDGAASDGKKVQVSATTIDQIVKELNLSRVDVIKADIEGAERDALMGASHTLKTFRPRLILDSYHRPDDMDAFRRVIGGAEPKYDYSCSYCEWDLSGTKFVPHITLWFVR